MAGMDRDALPFSPRTRGGRIDKTALRFGEEPRIRDRAWLDHFHAGTCRVPGCGAVGCDPAHVRYGQSGGTGLKPSDDLAEGFCHGHHMEQHAWKGGEADWWMERVIKPELRLNYKTWKERR